MSSLLSGCDQNVEEGQAGGMGTCQFGVVWDTQRSHCGQLDIQMWIEERVLGQHVWGSLKLWHWALQGRGIEPGEG